MAFSSANVFWLVISIAFSCRGIISVCSQETNCSRRIARGHSDKRKIHSGFPSSPLSLYAWYEKPCVDERWYVADIWNRAICTSRASEAMMKALVWVIGWRAYDTLSSLEGVRSKWKTLLRLFVSASHACRLNIWSYDSASYWYLRSLQ